MYWNHPIPRRFLEPNSQLQHSNPLLEQQRRPELQQRVRLEQHHPQQFPKPKNPQQPQLGQLQFRVSQFVVPIPWQLALPSQPIII
jgi:hypothetical protein